MPALSDGRLILGARRTITLFLCLCIVSMNGLSVAQQTSLSGSPVLHTFKLWGIQQSQLEKLDTYLGFTNGFFSGPRSPKFLALADCLEMHITSDQAVAMIAKYYTENPQRWGMPFGQEVIAALTVKDGPCAARDP